MTILVYIVGASGVGKDSLLNYVKSQISPNQKFIFAHRYITRNAFSGGENHVEVSKMEFIKRKNAGLFALDWESHGQSYGIGIEIFRWLDAGFNVIVNGSREYLPIAKAKIPTLIDILIDADAEIIAQRLKDRNREQKDEILKRISRTKKIQKYNYEYVILNNGKIETAGEELLKIISDLDFPDSNVQR